MAGGAVVVEAGSRRIVVMMLAAVMAVACLWPLAVAAQGAGAPQDEAARRAEAEAALEAGGRAGTRGPADIALIDQGVLKLRADHIFIPRAEGARIMRALGNVMSEETLVGLIMGLRPTDNWIVVARYIKEGYIKDDDARDWNADDLLQQLKEGTEAANRDRAARGFPEVEILGWVEQPAYDPANHRLVWSLLSKAKGEPEGAVKGINYNTYALGREGYFSLNLLTSSDRITADKPVAHALLADLTYALGKRYEDFDPGTDRVAAYGLAALVGGAALAKKLGLFAVIAAFAAKFAKVIIVAVIALGAGLVSLLRRRPKAGPPAG
jgi:uncharacterized membrane-anchored protein